MVKVKVAEVEPPAEEIVEDESSTYSERKELDDEKSDTNEESLRHLLKQQTLVELQQRYIQVICVYH